MRGLHVVVGTRLVGDVAIDRISHIDKLAERVLEPFSVKVCCLGHGVGY